MILSICLISGGSVSVTLSPEELEEYSIDPPDTFRQAHAVIVYDDKKEVLLFFRRCPAGAACFQAWLTTLPCQVISELQWKGFL